MNYCWRGTNVPSVVAREGLAHWVTKTSPTRFQRTFTAVPLADTMSIPSRMIS